MEHNHITLPEGSIEKTTTTLNIGPTHPATHARCIPKYYGSGRRAYCFF